MVATGRAAGGWDRMKHAQRDAIAVFAAFLVIGVILFLVATR